MPLSYIFQVILYYQVFVSLFNCLLLKVQRIPRYYLLLDDLAKNSDESNRELKGLIECALFMKEIANTINDSIEVKNSQSWRSHIDRKTAKEVNHRETQILEKIHDQVT